MSKKNMSEVTNKNWPSCLLDVKKKRTNRKRRHMSSLKLLRPLLPEGNFQLAKSIELPSQVKKVN